MRRGEERISAISRLTAEATAIVLAPAALLNGKHEGRAPRRRAEDLAAPARGYSSLNSPPPNQLTFEREAVGLLEPLDHLFGIVEAVIP